MAWTHRLAADVVLIDGLFQARVDFLRDGAVAGSRSFTYAEPDALARLVRYQLAQYEKAEAVPLPKKGDTIDLSEPELTPEQMFAEAQGKLSQAQALIDDAQDPVMVDLKAAADSARTAAAAAFKATIRPK
jgi:hypothetical protein